MRFYPEFEKLVYQQRKEMFLIINIKHLECVFLDVVKKR